MATTGFWPVKNRLKEVIEYTRNPDKPPTRNSWMKIYMQHSSYVEDDKKNRSNDICFGYQLSETKSIRIYDGY